MDDRGFTIIELVLVIIVAAIIAAVAVPQFSRYYGGIKLGNAAMKIASDIRYAQNRATTTQQRSQVKFIDSTQYYVYYCASYTQAICSCAGAGWIYAKDPFTRDDFKVNLSTDFSGVTISGIAFNYCIEFDSLGRPYKNDNTNCNDATSCNSSALATVTVQYTGEPNKTITVQTQTGMVSH